MNNHSVSRLDINRFVDINEVMMEKTACDELDSDKLFKELSVTQTRAICLIHFHHPCMMSQIAKSMGLTLGTVTALIDRLVSKKFVKRVRSQSDNRKVYASLTKKGHKVILARKNHVVKMAQTILSKLTGTEQKQFLSLFEKTVGD